MALILVVEDEPQILVFTEASLEDAGYDTLSASDYKGAHALLEAGHRPNLLFVDRNLGEGLTGIELARAARQYRPDMAVLYTSGDLMTDGVKAMLVEGGEFLPKPYIPEDLLSAVKRLLNGSNVK